MTQTISGKAWEYGIARKFADLLNVPLIVNNPDKKPEQNAYEYLPADEQSKISGAAAKAAEFLLTVDERLKKQPQNIHIQGDTRGQEGDVRNIMRYMIGRHDFYKIMKENGTVSLQSFNMDKTLKWGKPVAMPTKIDKIDMEPENKTTVLINFNGGWSLSMRIHNAESKLTPSVKFAVKLTGHPPNLFNHTIHYGQQCI